MALQTAYCAKVYTLAALSFCYIHIQHSHSSSVVEGPIQVYFKLPVSEISKIDDQRSVRDPKTNWGSLERAQLFVAANQPPMDLQTDVAWEPRMILNSSADWSTGEINVRGDMVEHFWTPDIIIHDLVSFYKPEILNQVAALEIKHSRKLYYKVRWAQLFYIIIHLVPPKNYA